MGRGFVGHLSQNPSGFLLDLAVPLTSVLIPSNEAVCLRAGVARIRRT